MKVRFVLGVGGSFFDRQLPAVRLVGQTVRYDSSVKPKRDTFNTPMRFTRKPRPHRPPGLSMAG